MHKSNCLWKIMEIANKWNLIRTVLLSILRNFTNGNKEFYEQKD
jgi:hypothetical protein